MYSRPLIVAPAAAVGTGSCQTIVRLRLEPGSASANAAAVSAAVSPGAGISVAAWAGSRLRPRGDEAPGREGRQ